MTMLLQQMQSLIAEINDVPVNHDVCNFLLQHLASQSNTDEQVLIAATDDGTELGIELGVYIDPAVLTRLQAHNPFAQLKDGNLADFCTALEGVSHFHYLVWCMERGRPVSLLELELQAEVDKYTVAQWLLMQQTQGYFPHGLHTRMFSQVSFVAELDESSLQRYQEANRHAAYYCQNNDQRFLRSRRRRFSQWLSELRQFYRCSHHAKLRRSIH
jgi:hypothetical protein